jgi:hypothetical protein
MTNRRSQSSWWTAIAVVDLVLDPRFLHSLGFVHGRLKSSFIFDVNHHIQISNFERMEVEDGDNEMGGFSGSRWTPQTDVRGFTLILFEILIGRSLNDKTSIPSTVPEFVSKIVEREVWSESNTRCSFCDIFRYCGRC